MLQQFEKNKFNEFQCNSHTSFQDVVPRMYDLSTFMWFRGDLKMHAHIFWNHGVLGLQRCNLHFCRPPCFHRGACKDVRVAYKNVTYMFGGIVSYHQGWNYRKRNVTLYSNMCCGMWRYAIKIKEILCYIFRAQKKTTSDSFMFFQLHFVVTFGGILQKCKLPSPAKFQLLLHSEDL